MIHIAFVRTFERPDRMHVRRADGTEVSWTFPTYGDALPHDLVHLVVEAAFGLRDGFWGKVAGGMDPRRANAQSDAPGTGEKYAGFGADRSALLLSEALANASWWDEDMGPLDRLSAIQRSCAQLGVDAPESMQAEPLASTQQTLLALRARWRPLVPRGALHFTFDEARGTLTSVA